MKLPYYVVALLVITVVVPFFLREYYIHIMIVIFYYIILTQSWNLIAGYTGQISLAQPALASMGAYTSALSVLNFGLPIWLGILCGAGITAAAGYGLGRLCLRMRGAYLALTTLGFSEIFRLIVSNEWQVTRGDFGLGTPLLFGGKQSLMPYYYVILATTALSLLAIYLILKSKIGLFLRSIREDEDAAWVLGIDIVKWKTIAFMISGFLAGLAGAVYVHYLGITTPSIGSIDELGVVVAMGVIGGLGRFAGPVVGAFIVEFASEQLRWAGQARMVIFGLALVLTMRFSRDGLLGFFERLYKRLTKTSARAD